MPRKPQQARARATVDAIIEAGFIAVSKRGTHATTTRQIAEIAGISVGSLYEYFADKEAIFEAMNQRFVAEVVALVQPLVPTLVRMPIDQAVYELLVAFGAFLRKNDERYLKFARDSMQAELQRHLEPVTRLLMDLVTHYIMHNPASVRMRNVPTMAYIFINGGIFAVVKHLSDPNPPMSYDELSRGLADMVGHYSKQELASKA
ncbi:MAG: TetR family transcriptional regulator [Moraxellaceae bacterium]|jgi:AcrR family transcriptional regulator|nr:TetR family transcriptional regulator [Moraxellaceae bacterium]